MRRRAALSSRQLARRAAGLLAAGLVPQLLLPLLAPLLGPVGLVAALCAGSALRRLAPHRHEATTWAGGAFLLALLGAVLGLTSGAAALVVTTLGSAAALGGGWAVSLRRDATLHRERLLARAERRTAPPTSRAQGREHPHAPPR